MSLTCHKRMHARHLSSIYRILVSAPVLLGTILGFELGWTLLGLGLGGLGTGLDDLIGFGI